MENKSKKILVVDDEETLRELFKDMLEGEGYSVDTAENGLVAVQLIQCGGYDLILLDILMPKMDGITVLRKIKDIKTDKPNGPIIMLSVLEESEFSRTCLKLGAKSYINKSMGTPEQILNKVKMMLL